MEHEKLSYVEALKWLAGRYHIEVEETEVSSEQKLQQQTAESLFIINQFAQKFYSEQLFETEEGRSVGLSYLQERGFTDEIAKKFFLGYAPAGKNTFVKAAAAARYNSDLVQKAGLAVQRNDELVDNYRDRIIFPVHNNSGKIVGFGARLIRTNDKAPKYINTPENELYVKSKILYGTYFARHAIDKANECLLVEGYTDVISLHQAGIENVVASGGTSLTQDQLRLIKKYSNNLTIVYDGDAAGIKAALRGLDMALEEGLNVKLVLIPDKEDPDSYVKKIGANEFRNFILHNKKDFILFQIETALKEAGNDSNKKTEAVNQVAETISKIDKAENFSKQQDYIRQSAQMLNVDESGFTNLVNKFIRNKISIQEKKLPFEEAKVHEENAKKAAENNFDDYTFSLLFKDDLQEKEIAKVLLEHGNKQWNDNQTIAAYVISELPDEDLIDNKEVLKLIGLCREYLNNNISVEKNLFVYNEDQSLSTLAVSLLQFPYEESLRWKQINQAHGYQAQLFQKSAKDFFKTINPEHKEELAGYLKLETDTTKEEVTSAINYLKLRKVKRLLLENQTDFQGAEPAKQMELMLTHQHLKQMEIELSRKVGMVVRR